MIPIYTENGGITLIANAPGEVDTYVDSGELYEQALAGEFGEVQPYVAPTPLLTTVANAAATRILSLMGDSEVAMAAITTGYPEGEITSWDKQEAEARAYTADPASPTPLLTAVATARGLSVAELAGMVIAKADAFAVAAGAIIGKRQALEDQIAVIVDDTVMTDDEKRAAIALVVW